MATKKPIRESAKAAAAFRVYCSLGPTRSLPMLADYLAQTGGKTAPKLRTVQRWASDFNWPGKIIQWELEQRKYAD